MFQKEKPWLEVRKQNNDSLNEVVLGHYIKSKKAYFLNAFFGMFFLKTLVWYAFCGLLLLFNFFAFKTDVSERMEFVYFCIGAIAFMFACWLIYVIIQIWFWKYSKHVIVTNQGIWIMLHSTGWWREAWNGKKYMFSAHWSFYDWKELSGVFEDQCRISKICKKKDFVMDRWDGEQEVRYLKPNEVEEIIEFSKQYINPRKRKKKRDPKPKRDWKFWLKESFKPNNKKNFNKPIKKI